jgi:hypothetical protein
MTDLPDAFYPSPRHDDNWLETSIDKDIDLEQSLNTSATKEVEPVDDIIRHPIDGACIPPIVDYIKPHSKRRIVLHLVARCGGKKSLRIREHIISLDQEAETARKKILMISARRIHAINMTAEMNDNNLGFKCYLNKKKKDYEFFEHDRSVVSLESIGLISSSFRPDIMILDELRTIASNTDRTTLWSDKKDSLDPIKNLNAFKAFVNKTPLAISADADTDFDDGCYSLLRGLTDCTVVEIRAKEKNLKRSMLIDFKEMSQIYMGNNNGRRTLLECALDDYLSSVKDTTTGPRRVAIACGSKSTAKKYGRMCLTQKIPFKLYISDASDSVCDDFKDPDKHWEKIGVIIFTSKLSVAVDPRRTHFGHLFIDTCRGASSL